MDLGLVIAVEEMAKRLLAARFADLRLEEIEVVVGVSVDYGNADIVVCVVRVG